jgi:hypothetical protein
MLACRIFFVELLSHVSTQTFHACIDRYLALWGPSSYSRQQIIPPQEVS